MKLTEKDIRQKKGAGPKIVMLTSYDYPTARLEAVCGVDVQLVGDSVGTNILGYDDVSQVTVEDMIHHTKAVARGAQDSFVLCDMPFGSFKTPSLALTNAKRLVEAGADGVKMEGEAAVLGQIRAVTAANIPVCAHIGYTPQTNGAQAAVQGKDVTRALELVASAKKVETAGACMVVLELIPELLAKLITETISIPTIGIGGGRYCDGQVQVVLDILGISDRTFRHAKSFDAIGERCKDAICQYTKEVRDGLFPTEKNASRLPDEVLAQVAAQLRRE